MANVAITICKLEKLEKLSKLEICGHIAQTGVN